MASDRCCAGRAADELSPHLASRPTPLEPPPRSAGLVKFPTVPAPLFTSIAPLPTV